MIEITRMHLDGTVVLQVKFADIRHFAKDLMLGENSTAKEFWYFLDDMAYVDTSEFANFGDDDIPEGAPLWSDEWDEPPSPEIKQKIEAALAKGEKVLQDTHMGSHNYITIISGAPTRAVDRVLQAVIDKFGFENSMAVPLN